MRIRLNGVNELEAWPAYEYARLWIKEGHLRADDLGKRRGQEEIKADIGHFEELLQEEEEGESQILVKERKSMLSAYIL